MKEDISSAYNSLPGIIDDFSSLYDERGDTDAAINSLLDASDEINYKAIYNELIENGYTAIAAQYLEKVKEKLKL
ncbi:hypothetical protein ACFL21_05330 [Patescibacteria group bacterium]